MLLLRRSDPGRRRPFRTPLVPVVPILALLGCIYLAAELPGSTWVRFFAWMALGIVVYVVYSRGHSAVSEARRR